MGHADQPQAAREGQGLNELLSYKVESYKVNPQTGGLRAFLDAANSCALDHQPDTEVLMIDHGSETAAKV